MPEILTESFCERCGTRYTFESAAPRSARLKGVKTFSRGLKNFVMSDDTSMDEAMAAARSETDREVTSQQLDAFHKTFNFCMSCRQYTCGNCWNEADGQCLSCAPHLGHEIMPAPFPDLPIGAGLAFPVEPAATNGHDAEAVAPLAWPTSDLMREPEPPPEPESGPIVEPAASFDDTSLPRFDEGADAGPISSAAEPIEEIDAAARLAVLGALGASSRPEPVVAAPVPVVEPRDEPVIEPQPEPVVAAEPDPVAATAAESELIPASTPEPVIEPLPRAPSPARLDQEDVPGRAAAAAGQTTDLLHRFRPGQSLDDEIAAFEREQALAATPEPEAVVAATPEPEPVVAPEPEAVVAPVPEPVVAATPEPEPVVAPVPGPVVAATPEPEPVVAATPEPVVAATPEPEPVVAATPEPEPVVAATPEPLLPAIGIAAVAASPAVDPLAPAAMAPTSPATEAAPAEPAPAPAMPRVDVVPQPTWQMVAPEPTIAAPATPPVATPAPNAEPQWPSQPAWPSHQPAHAAFLGANARNSSLDSLWAESAREVAAATPALPMAPTADARPSGVQPCISCGLSLSASARFCRRCGSRQG